MDARRELAIDARRQLEVCRGARAPRLAPAGGEAVRWDPGRSDDEAGSAWRAWRDRPDDDRGAGAKGDPRGAHRRGSDVSEGRGGARDDARAERSEEHTSELQSLR